MTAGIIVAIMITPIITSVAREVFMTVSRADKSAALALGATRVGDDPGRRVPRHRSGGRRAVMLGLGRAMGETVAVAWSSAPARGHRQLPGAGRDPRLVFANRVHRRSRRSYTVTRSSGSAWCCSP